MPALVCVVCLVICYTTTTKYFFKLNSSQKDKIMQNIPSSKNVTVIFGIASPYLKKSREVCFMLKLEYYSSWIQPGHREKTQFPPKKLPKKNAQHLKSLCVSNSALHMVGTCNSLLTGCLPCHWVT